MSDRGLVTYCGQCSPRARIPVQAAANPFDFALVLW
jgi:hypothetical protein